MNSSSMLPAVIPPPINSCFSRALSLQTRYSKKEYMGRVETTAMAPFSFEATAAPRLSPSPSAHKS